MSPQKSLPWKASVVTLFPEMFPGSLGYSLAGSALARGNWQLEAIDLRAYACDRHRTVDDAPFGGGPGMVLRADVVDAALAAVSGQTEPARPMLYMSPRGQRLDQARLYQLAEGPGVVILCGRFEGVDQRVLEARSLEEVSLGDFVLSGGEPAALALLDGCVRLLPGVIGTAQALAEESFTSGLLEYPHYTRPANWCGRQVPEVLLSGHHERIRAWRQEEAETITRLRRPELWARRMGTVNARQDCID